MCPIADGQGTGGTTKTVIINNIGKKGGLNIVQDAITAIIMQFSIIAKFLGIVKGFLEIFFVLYYISLFSIKTDKQKGVWAARKIFLPFLKKPLHFAIKYVIIRKCMGQSDSTPSQVLLQNRTNLQGGE